MSSRLAAMGFAAAMAFSAAPALAQMHGGHMGGGGGGHTGGASQSGAGVAHSAGTPFNGRTTWRSGTWRGGDRDHDHDWHGHHRWWGGCCGFWGLGLGWWGDPFWGWPDYYQGYAWESSVEPYDDMYDFGPPGPPPGYDCDGWRWDPAQGRYVPAKVSCN